MNLEPFHFFNKLNMPSGADNLFLIVSFALQTSKSLLHKVCTIPSHLKERLLWMKWLRPCIVIGSLMTYLIFSVSHTYYHMLTRYEGSPTHMHACIHRHIQAFHELLLFPHEVLFRRTWVNSW